MRLTAVQRSLVVAAVSALLVSVVGFQTRVVFESGYTAWLVAMIPVGSLLIGVAARRTPWWARAVMHSGYALVLGAVAVGRQRGSLPGDLFEAATRGLTATLSARWPVPLGPVTVAGVVLMVAVAAAVTVELALSRRFGVAVLLPSACVLLLTALLAAPAGPPSAQVLAAFVLLSLVILRNVSQLRQDLPIHARGTVDEVQRRFRLNNAIVGTTALLVGLVPAFLGGLLAEDGRLDLRDRFEPTRLPEDEPSPLARLDEWRTRDPETAVFTTSEQGASRWRLAALTRYDGRTWLPPDDFRPSANDLQRPIDEDAVVDVDVLVQDLGARWYPTPARPTEIDQDVLVDGTFGNLLANDDLAPGTQFRLAVDETRTASAELAGVEATPPLQTLVDGAELDPEIVQLASSIVAGAQTDQARAAALASHLAERYQLVTDSPAGHSLGIMELFLTKTRRGRDEQFVSAYALLAQAVGLPVRVVVGFDLERLDDGRSVAWSDEIKVWPEIEFEGVGWVAFDPVPAEETLLDTSGDSAAAAVTDEEEPPPTTAPAPPATQPRDQEAATPPTLEVGSGVARGALVVMLVLVLIASYVIAVLRLKASRVARRRRSDSAEERTLGAFRAGVDMLVDLGVNAPRSRTDREIVEHAVDVVGGPSGELAPVAQLATQAVFDAPEPTDELAAEAWERFEAFQASARERLGAWQYARTRLSLRSLRRGMPDPAPEPLDRSDPLSPGDPERDPEPASHP